MSSEYGLGDLPGDASLAECALMSGMLGEWLFRAYRLGDLAAAPAETVGERRALEEALARVNERYAVLAELASSEELEAAGAARVIGKESGERFANEGEIAALRAALGGQPA
jgi:hypothetical protein